MSNMAQLRNWQRDTLGCLSGKIYSDPRWPDGTPIRTTQVQVQDRMGDALIARTRNTEYELVREDGSEWFSKANASV